MARPSCSEVRLTPRRLWPDPSFECLPVQYARAWPRSSASATAAAVVLITDEKHLTSFAANLPTWDEHVLSSVRL